LEETEGVVLKEERMPIANFKFFNIAVKIDRIKDFDDILRQKGEAIGRLFWYDRFIYFGSELMGYRDNETNLQGWIERGLNPTKHVDGVEFWDDLCVIASGADLQKPCEWIDYDIDRRIVKHKEDKSELYVFPNAYDPSIKFKGSIIVGQYKDTNEVRRGVVAIDNIEVCYNIEPSGFFYLLVPSAFIDRMNADGNDHRLTLYDFTSGHKHEYVIDPVNNKTIFITIFNDESNYNVEYREKL